MTYCFDCRKHVNAEKKESCKERDHDLDMENLWPGEIMVRDSKKENPLKKVKKLKGTIGDVFVESIILNDKPAFLLNKDGKLNLALELSGSNGICIPYEKNDCGYTPYTIDNTIIKVYSTNMIELEQLLDEIKKYIDYYIDICERDKILILVDLFLSYCQEKIHTLHYPYFVGETESGKSTALYFFKQLGYRCLYSQDMTSANVFEFVGRDEEGTGIICEDEAEELYKNRDKLRIYKNTYAKGSKIPRIINADSAGRKQVFYNGFCLKVFAGEFIPENKGFNERLAVIHMTEGYPKGNIKSLSDKQQHNFNDLRNKLLLYKVQNINHSLEHVEFGLEKRDAELWQDFLNVIGGTKYEHSAKQVVKYYTEQRHQAIWNSLDARIFKLLYPKLKENQIKLQEFWNHLTCNQEDLGGRLDKETWYPYDYYQKVTRHYLSKLFTEKYQGTRTEHIDTKDDKQHKTTLYEFDGMILDKLCKKYNYSDTIPNGQHGQLGQQSGVESPHEQKGGKLPPLTLDQHDQLDQVKETRIHPP